jgi:acyl-CoA synthetase (AMP-forming)/AMP-acid ligase II
MVSILDQLDRLGEEHPHKILYSYLDLNGNVIECYSYRSFIERTKSIAGHLLKDGRFAREDRLLLAYPPGLEMICAFIGCVRAGLIPVPVYPPSSRGFQSALYKMVHIAKDCQAAGILTSADYQASLKTNLTRSGVSASGVDVDYISSLPWIVTERFVDAIWDERCNGDARQYSADLSAGDRPSESSCRFLASAIPRYGTDRVLPLPGFERRYDVRLCFDGLHSAADTLV